MISVYDIGNTNYTGNGNAVLQPTECRLRNIAGGNYDMTMTHSIDPEGKWKHLVPGAIIKAPVPREEIENAYAGYDADVYKTTAQAELRESASEPTAILYPEWNPNNSYQVGSKVRVSTWSHKNYQCTYYDETSRQIMVPPYNSSWWKPIADQTSGAPVLVTLPEGTDLYFVEDYDTNWYKMSTYYGVVGYIKKDKVQYDRHMTPSETQPRIITEQLFRIEKPTVDTKSGSVTLTAKHVSYDLAGILVQNVSIAQASPAMALGRIVEGFMMDYEGTIATDMQTADYGTYTGDIKGKNGIFALLDPDKGIVSTFNAAYKRDNWDLFVLTKNTVDRGYRLKYRKNMLGVNWAQDASGLVTRVVPVAKDEKGENLYLPEKWIDSPLINTYPRVRMEQLPVKGQVGKDKGTGDGSTWTESDLLDEMRTKAAERFSMDEADKITVTVTVDFEQLGDAEEHKELKGMETVLLYDRVTVENEEIGLSVQLYVSEWEWDAIRKKITSLKLANTTDYKKGNVTGYNVQNKSIGSEKLTDEVTGEILQQAVDIMPEYAEPFDSQTHLNTKDRDGIVPKGNGQSNKVWKTDAQGNPAWRDEAAGITVVDNLNSTSATDALSANMGRLLNINKADEKKLNGTSFSSVGSLTDLQTLIKNFVTDHMTDNSVCFVTASFSASFEPFGGASFGMRLYRSNASYFSVLGASYIAYVVNGTYNNGTWAWEKIAHVDIVDNLTTNDGMKALSAAKGYALNSKIVLSENIGWFTNITDLFAAIKTKVASMTGETINTIFSAGATTDYWSSGTFFTGFLTKIDGNNYKALFSNQIGEILSIGTYDNGTSFQYESSKKLNSKLFNSAFGATSDSDLKSKLINAASELSPGEMGSINFYCAYNSTWLEVNYGVFCGILTKYDANFFAIKISTTSGNFIHISYDNGTWKAENISSKTTSYEFTTEYSSILAMVNDQVTTKGKKLPFSFVKVGSAVLTDAPSGWGGAEFTGIVYGNGIRLTVFLKAYNASPDSTRDIFSGNWLQNQWRSIDSEIAKINSKIALIGKYFDQSNSVATGGSWAETTVCSKTVTDQGWYIIVSVMGCSNDANIIYQHLVKVNGNTLTTIRSTQSGGGGSSNVAVAHLNANDTVSTVGRTAAGTTLTGQFWLVRLNNQ